MKLNQINENEFLQHIAADQQHYLRYLVLAVTKCPSKSFQKI